MGSSILSVALKLAELCKLDGFKKKLHREVKL